MKPVSTNDVPCRVAVLVTNTDGFVSARVAVCAAHNHITDAAVQALVVHCIENLSLPLSSQAMLTFWHNDLRTRLVCPSTVRAQRPLCLSRLRMSRSSKSYGPVICQAQDQITTPVDRLSQRSFTPAGGQRTCTVRIGKLYTGNRSFYRYTAVLSKIAGGIAVT